MDTMTPEAIKKRYLKGAKRIQSRALGSARVTHIDGDHYTLADADCGCGSVTAYQEPRYRTVTILHSSCARPRETGVLR